MGAGINRDDNQPLYVLAEAEQEPALPEQEPERDLVELYDSYKFIYRLTEPGINDQVIREAFFIDILDPNPAFEGRDLREEMNNMDAESEERKFEQLLESLTDELEDMQRRREPVRQR